MLEVRLIAMIMTLYNVRGYHAGVAPGPVPRLKMKKCDLYTLNSLSFIA